MAMDQQYTDALKELQSVQGRIAELERDIELREEKEKMDLAMLRKAREERDALAAHVERLHDTLAPFAQAWQQREPVGDSSTKAYQRRLARALEGFYSAPRANDEGRLILTGEHLRDAAKALSAPVGAASIANRDALKQAEALTKLVDQWGSECGCEADPFNQGWDAALKRAKGHRDHYLRMAEDNHDSPA